MWTGLTVDVAAIVTSGLEFATQFMPIIIPIGGLYIGSKIVRYAKSLF